MQAEDRFFSAFGYNNGTAIWIIDVFGGSGGIVTALPEEQGAFIKQVIQQDCYDEEA